MSKMVVNVFINFDGNCREALNFYSEVFGAKPSKVQTFAEIPTDDNFPIPEEAKNLICYSDLNVSGNLIMFSDVFPGMTLNKGNNLSIALTFNNMDHIKNTFNKLKEGGNIEMELQETFWTKLYGCVKDKFGVIWQFNYYAD